MVQTIALVDDDRNLLTGISIALEREGYKVQTYVASGMFDKANRQIDILLNDLEVSEQQKRRLMDLKLAIR